MEGCVRVAFNEEAVIPRHHEAAMALGAPASSGLHIPRASLNSQQNRTSSFRRSGSALASVCNATPEALAGRERFCDGGCGRVLFGRVRHSVARDGFDLELYKVSRKPDWHAHVYDLARQLAGARCREGRHAGI